MLKGSEGTIWEDYFMPQVKITMFYVKQLFKFERKCMDQHVCPVLFIEFRVGSKGDFDIIFIKSLQLSSCLVLGPRSSLFFCALVLFGSCFRGDCCLNLDLGRTFVHSVWYLWYSHCSFLSLWVVLHFYNAEPLFGYQLYEFTHIVSCRESLLDHIVISDLCIYNIKPKWHLCVKQLTILTTGKIAPVWIKKRGLF